MLDFELAAINDFEFVLPSIKARGCMFRFGQNLIRKLKSLGLK